jgi:hypothetical protein
MRRKFNLFAFPSSFAHNVTVTPIPSRYYGMRHKPLRPRSPERIILRSRGTWKKALAVRSTVRASTRLHRMGLAPFMS